MEAANQKSSFYLMQNCDLPPPVLLFSSPDETFHSSISKIYQHMGGNNDEKLIIIHKDFSGYNDKLEILKALRLSQTRAREAERKLRILSKEKEMVSNVLVDKTLRLFAHRQWVCLLELQVSMLEREQQEESRKGYYGGSNCAEKSWCAAIAFCLAIAGMGSAIGCRYLF